MMCYNPVQAYHSLLSLSGSTRPFDVMAPGTVMVYLCLANTITSQHGQIQNFLSNLNKEQ